MRRRWKSLLFRGIAVISALWIAFVLALDLIYGMTPRVTVGGLKILVAGYLVLGLAMVSALGLAALVRRIRAEKSRVD